MQAAAQRSTILDKRAGAKRQAHSWRFRKREPAAQLLRGVAL